MPHKASFVAWLCASLMRQRNQQDLIIRRIGNNGQIRLRMNIDRKLSGRWQREHTSNGLVDEVDDAHGTTQVICGHQRAAFKIISDRTGTDAYPDAQRGRRIGIQGDYLVACCRGNQKSARYGIESYTLRETDRARGTHCVGRKVHDTHRVAVAICYDGYVILLIDGHGCGPLLNADRRWRL